MTEQKEGLSPFQSRKALNDRIAQIKKNSKTKWIHNEVLGMTTKERVEEAIKTGAIVLRNGHYFVATEEKTIAVEAGHGQKVPKKFVVVSQKWYDFKKKYANAHLKSSFENKDNLTLFN